VGVEKGKYGGKEIARQTHFMIDVELAGMQRVSKIEKIIGLYLRNSGVFSIPQLSTSVSLKALIVMGCTQYLDLAQEHRSSQIGLVRLKA
jgi:hypothetical protein